MKHAFMCSLCRNGILGGGLYLEKDTLTYRTRKLTVEKKFRNLVLPRNEIETIRWRRILFPIATFRMRSGEEYTFLLFNKRRFLAYWNSTQ